MNGYQLIVSPIVGAIIGYITNWLAIKMLFRPHYEKKIGKFTIPFTPGIIPKEKMRIAANVGQAVGEHLLTEDDLAHAIASAEMDQELCVLIDETVSKWSQEERTVYDFLQQMYGSETDRQVDKLACRVMNWIQTQAYSEEFQLRIKEFVSNETFKQELQKNIDEWVQHGTPSLLQNLLQYIQQPEQKENIKLHLKNIITQKFGALVAGFIKMDTVYEILIHELEKYISKQQNIDWIVAEVNLVVEQLMYKGDRVVEVVSNKVREGLQNEKVQALIKDALLQEIRQLFATPIKEWVSAISPRFIDSLKKVLVEQFHTKVKQYAPRLIQKIDVPKIVEKRIQAFDPAYAEEIIISVMNKELQAITWLGAVLGFVMGFLTPLLSKLLA